VIPIGRSTARAALAGAAFLLLATANSGGYRYGASDQAFYIPAVEQLLDPSLFPRDRTLIEGQSRLLLSDDVIAWIATTVGTPLTVVCAIGFAAAGLLLGSSLWHLAGALRFPPWTAAALVLAMTLRHRITQTGVNSFEGYFHPRVLAYGLGVGALAAILAKRRRLAAISLLVGIMVHPTTALWFALWLALAGGAAALREPSARHPVTLLVVSTPIALVLVLAIGGGLLPQLLQRMEGWWVDLLRSKDYLFPDEWPLTAWLVHAATVGAIVVVYRKRRVAGLVSPWEASIFGGALALVAGFLLSLPLIAARFAVAVQLQTSRVLWPVEMLATAYVVWAFAHWPVGRSERSPVPSRYRAVALAVLLAAAATTRGVYVTWFERSDGALVRMDLPANEWTSVMTWVRTETEPDAHLIADPGHAWKYGTSLRIGAARDVYLEEVKDVAIALYSRQTAARVLERIAAPPTGDNPGELEAFVARYGLDYAVCENDATQGAGTSFCRGTRLWSNGRFSVFDLRSGSR
jgi:hypothetical protein